jgi:formiminotetrahydrofolate cyclodeaminase
MTVRDLPLNAFLAELGSKAPTPGGGGAAAMLGAVGAALCGMVAHLTIGKKKYASVEADMQSLLARADGLRAKLAEAIDADADAFDTLMRAYGLPKQSEQDVAAREAAIQDALGLAIEAPLGCARLCREAIDLAVEASGKGNTSVVSDGGVAVLAAHAGLRASALNVLVNVKLLTDRHRAAATIAELDRLMDGAATLTEKTYEDVRQQLM